jgi:branched-chain amino acid transport system substrate-binding protein
MNIKNFKGVKKSSGLILVILLLTLGLFGASCKPSATNATRPVKVATNLPMSGGLAVYGKSVQRGGTMALEDLRASNPNGPAIEFDWQDNAGNPQTTVSIMQQQYLNPPDIYVSGVRPQTTAIWDQISAKGTPHFVWIFEMLVNPKSRNNLRTWVNFKAEPQIYLQHVDKIKPKRVAILHTKIPSYHDEIQQILLPGLKQRGINDVLVEEYDFETSDFKPLAVKTQAFKPDLIVLQGFQSHLVGLVRALRPYSLIKDGNTLATYDMLDAADVLGQDELEGIRFAAPYFVTRADQTEVTNWRARFSGKYNAQPLYTDAFAYDMVMVINDAAKRLTLPATSEQWINALRATNIQGVTGPLKFDEDGSLVTPIELGVFHNGKPTSDSVR